MAAVTVDSSRAADLDLRGPVPARTGGPAAAGRSPAMVRPGRNVRSWPLVVLAAPAAAEVWSGWVGIAKMTGFGLVSPLPGIWPALRLDTAITLPVEAYAAYALRAWLARDQAISGRTRRFAKWSAICSALGMAGQVAYHLMAQAGMARAPWPVTTVMSRLPVLVLSHEDDAGPHAPRRRRGRRYAGQPDQAASGLAVRVLVRGPGGTGLQAAGAGPGLSASRDHNGPRPRPRHGTRELRQMPRPDYLPSAGMDLR